MKNMATWFLLGLVSLGGAAWAQAQDANADTEKTVRALEAQWMESQRTNNPDLLAPLLADSIVSTDTEGKVRDKAGMLAYARAAKYESVEYSDIEVSVYGDAAVATGGFRATGTGADGKAIGAPERWTDTWVKMPDGKWRCVATHGSLIAK